MKPFAKRHTVLFAILLLATMALAGMDLSNLRANTVRDQWGDTKVSVDTLRLQTHVDQGVATSIVTLCLTPKGYLERHYDRTQEKYVYEAPEPLDSVEVTLSFWMPRNFAATDMYLWVEGEKVKAYLQDRSTARAQYEDIVRRRRDPALLEYYGHGSYCLRIFPCKSFETRKIEIEFIHSLADSGSTIAGEFPVSFRHYTYSYNSYYGPYDSIYTELRHIGLVEVKAQTSDMGTYFFEIAGVGSGFFSTGFPMTLRAEKVDSLGYARMSMRYCLPGKRPFVWQSKERFGKGAFGFSVDFDKNDLTFEPEPTARILVMDVRGNREKALDRAKKLAVLSLKHYVAQNQTFNLVLSGENESSSAVLFSKPQKPTTDNLRLAYAFLLGIRENKVGSTEAGIAKAISTIGSKGDGLILLFSDDTVTAAMDRLTTKLKQAGVPLFGYFDSWHLGQVAYQTGGMQLGYLSYEYYWYYGYAEDQGTVIGYKDGKALRIYMQPLYGPDTRYDYYPYVDNLEVKLVSGYVADFAYVHSRQYYYRYPIMIDAVAKANASTYDYPVLELHLAGLVDKTTRAVFEVSGTCARQKFKGRVAVDINRSSEGQSKGDALFGLYKTEMLAMAGWDKNHEAIKQYGRQYHVVTQQTSLLALEPGMAPWDSMSAAQDNSGNAGTGGTSESADARTLSAGLVAEDVYYSPLANPLDAVSLDDLIAADIKGTYDQSIANPRHMQLAVAKMKGGGYQIQFNPGTTYLPAGAKVQVRIYDVGGRLVQQLSQVTGDGTLVFQWNGRDSHNRVLSGGRYYLVTQVGSYEMRRTILLSR